MNPNQVLVVCRQASDFLRPGSVTGYFCRTCGKELQVSPTGVRQIRELGGVPYCNGCGLTLARKQQAREKDSVECVLNEDAQQYLREKGVLDELVKGKPVVEVTPDEFFDEVKLRQKLRRAGGN